MQEKTNLINDGGTMEKKFELLTFDELLKLPIDIESCFDPVFDPPIYLLDEWRKNAGKRKPVPRMCGAENRKHMVCDRDGVCRERAACR